MIPSISHGPPTPAAATSDQRLRDLSIKLEATFLAEMLGHTGMGKAPDGFGGGIGEDQFASFLRTAQAEAMAKAGGIGLAEHLFRAMTAGANDAGRD